tara:strand:- start:253 stop:2526 length:2274 start_codon:yes stop_codon:yes gene_type:complete
MTLSSATNRNDYVGNNSTATYNYTFKIFNKNDLLVTKKDTNDVETTLTVDTDYTVTGVSDINGGTIVLTAGNLATGYALTIRRVRTVIQETDIRNQGDFFPESHEDAFDHQIMIAQQQQDELDRSSKLPESIPSSSFDPTLPTDIKSGGGRALKINDDGNGFELGPTATQVAQYQDAINSAPPWFNVLDYGDGTRTLATINAAITAIEDEGSLGAGAKYTLLIKRGTWVMDSNRAIPSNVQLLFEMGSIFSISSGVTITYNNSQIIAPIVQIFLLSGTGKFVFSGSIEVVYPQWWGAVGDGTTDDTIAFTAMFACGAGSFRCPKKTYYFGSIETGVHFPITSDTHIDWQWSTIKIDGPVIVGSTPTFLSAVDCRLHMNKYIFEDTNFTHASGVRGCVPIGISSIASSVSGYSFGPFWIKKGGSLLTCTSGTPSTYRASDIRFIGDCIGDDVYYGVNLAGNGDGFRGSYSINNQCHRAIFIYGVKNIYADFYCKTGSSSSANINLGAYSTDKNVLKNVYIRAKFETMGGWIKLVSDNSASDVIYDNIKLDVFAETISSNVTSAWVQIGKYDSSGNFETSCTNTVKRLKLKLDWKTNTNNVTPVKEVSTSTNYALICWEGTKKISFTQVPSFHVKIGNKFYRGVRGDTTVTSLYLDPIHLLEEESLPSNKLINAILKMTIAQSSTFYGQAASLNLNAVKGFISSTPTLTLTDTQEIWEADITTNPTITIVAASNLLKIDVSGYASVSSGYLIAEWESCL